MSLNEFISKWTGRHVDTDGVYPDQCMDLMHQYCIDVLGITDPTVLAQPAAYMVFANFTDTNHFVKIANTLDGIPSPGDIMVFDDGTFGHVSIFIEGDVSRFTSFDANFPLGSLPHIQEHNYIYPEVLGWLHPTIQFQQPPMDENIKRKSYFFDLIWHSIYGIAIDTDKVTESDVMARNKEAQSEKYRSGQWDKLLGKVGYTGATDIISAEKAYEIVLGKTNETIKRLQDDLRTCLADSPRLRQQVIDECISSLTRLKG